MTYVSTKHQEGWFNSIDAVLEWIKFAYQKQTNQSLITRALHQQKMTKIMEVKKRKHIIHMQEMELKQLHQTQKRDYQKAKDEIRKVSLSWHSFTKLQTAFYVNASLWIHNYYRIAFASTQILPEFPRIISEPGCHSEGQEGDCEASTD